MYLVDNDVKLGCVRITTALTAFILPKVFIFQGGTITFLEKSKYRYLDNLCPRVNDIP